MIQKPKIGIVQRYGPILADRIEVNYFTTQTPAIEDHEKCTVRDRKKRLSQALSVSQDLVSQRRQRQSNHNASFNEVCPNESSMVGEDNNGSYCESYSDTECRT
jgi:hypothetical protein